jgi:hypothetical protein
MDLPIHCAAFLRLSRLNTWAVQLRGIVFLCLFTYRRHYSSLFCLLIIRGCGYELWSLWTFRASDIQRWKDCKQCPVARANLVLWRLHSPRPCSRLDEHGRDYHIIWTVLMMVCIAHRVTGSYPEGKRTPTLLGPLERANLSHWTSYSECFTTSAENITITDLDIIHCPALYLKHYFLETRFCLSLQVEPTQMGPTERTSLCYRTRKRLDLSVGPIWVGSTWRRKENPVS